MSFWDEWFRRTKERRGFFFPEIDNLIEELEREMAEASRDMVNRIPRDLVRVRRLPDGSVVREYGPFIYGYSVKIGPDGKPSVRAFGNIKPGPGGEVGNSLNLLEKPLVQLCLREPLHEPAEPHLRRRIVEAAKGGEVRVIPESLDEFGEAVYLEEHLDEDGPEVGDGRFGSSASAFHVV